MELGSSIEGNVAFSFLHIYDHSFRQTLQLQTHEQNSCHGPVTTCLVSLHREVWHLAAGVKSCNLLAESSTSLLLRLTLGEQCVSISVVQVLRRRQAADEVVSVTSVVARSPDLPQVSHLVQDSRSLVLSVAGTAQRRQASEEQGAVDHLAGRGVCVRQHTAGAGAEDVGAVVPAVAAGGGAALSGDTVEDGLDSALCRGSTGLEVFSHLGIVGLGVRSRGARKRCTVGECVKGRGAAGASAVGLDNCALGELLVIAADLAGLLAVDRSIDAVADERNGTSNLGRVEVGIGESALGEDLEVTTSAQVVGNSDIKGSFKGLPSSNDLEGRLIEVAGADAETDALEGDLLLSLEDLDLLDVRVIEEGAGLEKLEVLGSSVLDQSLDSGVAGELEFNVERRVIKREAGSQSSQSGKGEDLNLHDGRCLETSS